MSIDRHPGETAEHAVLRATVGDTCWLLRRAVFNNALIAFLFAIAFAVDVTRHEWISALFMTAGIFGFGTTAWEALRRDSKYRDGGQR